MTILEKSNIVSFFLFIFSLAGITTAIMKDKS